MAFFQIFTVLAMTSLVRADHHHGHQGDPSVGYSFAKFSGPVSGPASEIITHDKHHGHQVDYVAKPDYQFEYGVEDPKSQVSQFRKENRQDDAVVGEYSYTDPFGHVRTVKYTADKLHGFRAEIYIDGKLETPHVPQVPEHHHHHAQAQHENNNEEDDGDYNEGSDSDY